MREPYCYSDASEEECRKDLSQITNALVGCIAGDDFDFMHIAAIRILNIAERLNIIKLTEKE